MALRFLIRNAPMVTPRAGMSMLLSRSKVRGPSFSLFPKQPHMISRPFMYARVIAPINISSIALAIRPVQRNPIPAISKRPSSNSNHGEIRAAGSTAHDRQDVVGTDDHAEKKLVIAEVPAAVEIKLGERGKNENNAERDRAPKASGRAARPPGVL